MQESDIPASFVIRWAASAGGTYVHAIPTTSQIGIVDGAASLPTGFVPLNFLPVEAGGVPPFGNDMNGILQMLSGWSQWGQAGVLAKYDGTFATAIGGYPKNAMLSSTTLGTLWQSTVDNNAADPDAGATPDWFNAGRGKLINIQAFDTAGTYSFTKTPGANRFRVRGCGGSGAGGGTQATGSGQVAVGGGGGAGAQGEVWIDVDVTGTTIIVGAAGVPVSGAMGGDGGASAFGTYLVLPFGGGGAVGIAASPPFANAGGLGAGVASSVGTDKIIIALSGGQPGGIGVAFTTSNGASGQGGSCGPWGAGGIPSAGGAGNSAQGNGAGGSGALALASTAAQAGGAGAAGRIVVEEYT